MSTIWRHFLSLLMKTKNDWLIKVSVPNWYWKACIVLAWHMTIRTLCSNFSLTATEQSWTMKFESRELSSLAASHSHSDHQPFIHQVSVKWERDVSGSNNPIFAEFQAIIQPFSLEVFCNPILSNYVGFCSSAVIKTLLMSNINTSSSSPWNVFEISITLLKSFSI